MTRFIFISLAAFFCAHAVAQTRIDASTENAFNTSLNSMRQELAPKKLAQLNTALMFLPFAGMESFKDAPPDGTVKLAPKKLDGMTADQIIELARKTVTVKIAVGPPPGLPKQFKAPLRPVSDTARRATEDAWLGGTQWMVTDNINGHISEERLKLLPDGNVDDGASVSGRWEQVGAKVRIAPKRQLCRLLRSS